MKRLIAGVICAAGLAGMAAADPVFGNWRTAPDDNGNTGLIQVQACGSKICGTLVRAYDGTGAEMASPNVGKRIIWDMESKGGGAYADGKVWSPDRDKTYKSKMQLSGDRLAISGCILMVCRDGGTWTRAN
ncbi:DUF2147 domain-containing protein [Sedimentitalea sp. JM2-8]|uniref:DUF2147 domain-containing protein n=1 Tax=Sedimentitalea xiamensis TaxID=3050037 RepID=A0ABT7FKM6_9RHOB|nr:DUF2147 domain-containing protein [Sedimentitalea xiamensis]MDK3075707.1 DUF2147 domain-containing protein [Sedimentitalea xiamensis]